MNESRLTAVFKRIYIVTKEQLHSMLHSIVVDNGHLNKDILLPQANILSPLRVQPESKAKRLIIFKPAHVDILFRLISTKSMSFIIISWSSFSLISTFSSLP